MTATEAELADDILKELKACNRDRVWFDTLLNRYAKLMEAAANRARSFIVREGEA